MPRAMKSGGKSGTAGGECPVLVSNLMQGSISGGRGGQPGKRIGLRPTQRGDQPDVGATPRGRPQVGKRRISE